ncbi:MAG: AraC family transcriptional regulator [Sphingomonas sp.]
MTEDRREEARGGEARAPYDVIHAQMLRGFPELVGECGGDPDAMLAQAGIDPALLDRDDGEITYRAMVDLLERSAAALGRPDLGMRLARRQGGYSVFGPLGLIMRHSRSFGDALDYVRGHTHAHSPAVHVWRRRLPGGGAVFMGHDLLLDRVHARAQAMEQILLLGHLAAIDLTGGHVRARHVHFRHQPVSPPRLYRRYFGCDVSFGQDGDGIIFSDADLARPIVDADAQVHRAVADYIESEFAAPRTPLDASVRGIVARRLAGEACTNADVAAELGLHPRTLHRRLAREGTSFHRIKDAVRRDAMLYYLERTGFDLARISERLGFAEQSVMSRRCRTWFGASPSAVRARARA